MMKRIWILCLLMSAQPVWADTHPFNLQVQVARDGSRYNFSASFDTTLTQCAAYQYLTDYAAAKFLPGVLESKADRRSANLVRVERIADEQILFFHVRLHSVMEYTEIPFEGVTFTQLEGDSKAFQGSWDIVSNARGSSFSFRGVWVPDTLIPLFIIDHFARNGLRERFTAIAELAEKRKGMLSGDCESFRLATIGEQKR
jgi:hypothetical protein